MVSRLVVLGGCGAWPEPGRACNGFLLEHGGFRVVMDLGYGTLPRLLAQLGSAVAAGVDAAIATHHHPDHVVDLHGLFRARLYAGRHLPRIPLYAPETVPDRIGALKDGDRRLSEQVFAWRPLRGNGYDVGPFRLKSRLLPHYVPNAGVRLSSPELRWPTPETLVPIPRWWNLVGTPTCSSSTPPIGTRGPRCRRTPDLQ